MADKRAQLSDYTSRDRGWENKRKHGSTGPPSAVHRPSFPRLKSDISPPPLKRLCTGLATPKETSDEESVASISARSSFGGRPRKTKSTNPKGDRPSSIPQVKDISTESPSVTNIPKSVKPTCRRCGKNTSRNFDPIIFCPGCRRSYHDACRKPPLASGVDPQQWRCARCTPAGSSNRDRSLKSASIKSTGPPLALKLFGGSRRSSFDPNARPASAVSTVSIASIDSRRSNFSDRTVSSSTNGTRGEERPSSRHSHQSFNSTCTAFEDSGSKASKMIASTSNMQPDSRTMSQAVPASSRKEIPNTPTQRSSQLNTVDPLQPILRTIGDTTSEGDDFEVLAQSRTNTTEAPVLITTLCKACQRKPRMARHSSSDDTCSDCWQKSFTSEEGDIEIPETPESDDREQDTASTAPRASTNLPHTKNVFDADAEEEKRIAVRLTKLRDLAAIGSRARDQIVEAFDRSDLLSDPILARKLPWVETITGSWPTDLYEDITALEDELRALQRRRIGSTIAVSPTSEGSEKDGEIHDVLDTTTLSFSDTRLRSDNDGQANHSDIQGYHDIRNSTKTVSEANKVDAYQTPVREKTRESTSSADVPGSQSADSRVGPMSSKDTTPCSEVDVAFRNTSGRRLTIRDLARVALVAAQGSRLTAAEVVDLLMRKLPNVLEGDNLAKSIPSALSRFPEFKGDRIAGSRENKKRWSFANTRLRSEYEKQYSEVLASAEPNDDTRTSTSAIQREKKDQLARTREPPGSGTEQVEEATIPPTSPLTLTINLGRSQKKLPHLDTAIKTTSEQMSQSNQPTDSVQMQVAIDVPVKAISEDTISEQPLFMPFELSSWKRICIGSQVPVISEEERQQKIVEIKARPSRKEYFGSDHRLAHVRRYGRKDAHDESDGAWQPRPRTTRGFSRDSRIEIILDRDIDLPKIPMLTNDGEGELAFRDGTTINGRLPRARNIYRVGKVSGGELTVRTS